MQLKSSLKQLLVESRANPGFTSLYVGGVAFAVAFTMIFAIIYYVHLAPLYPEYNRSSTYYINNLTVRNDKTSNMSQSSVGIPLYASLLKTPRISNIRQSSSKSKASSSLPTRAATSVSISLIQILIFQTLLL